jgi:eukaryotic-like serine/threonine-protein kinase
MAVPQSRAHDLHNADDPEDDGAPVSCYVPGEALPGDCLAWERLGVGQRCETWLAWSPQLWCPSVVKFPRPHQTSHPRARQSLGREVAALSGNLHPGLARLYQDGTRARVPYLVFEYVDGIALDDEIDEGGVLEPREIALLATQLLAALRTVHARGLAHVDIKPANIMLRKGRSVLLDFGSSRAIGALQPAGKLIGSPGYAGLDLEMGEPISAAMDVFGLGVTLYETMTGHAAFDPDLAAADRSAPPSLPDSTLADLVVRMFDPDPAARPDVDSALRAFGDLAEEAGDPAWPRWAQATRTQLSQARHPARCGGQP